LGRRRARFVLTPSRSHPSVTGPPTDSVGLKVVREWTITEATLDVGLVHYELRAGDQVLWSGFGVTTRSRVCCRSSCAEGDRPDEPKD